MEPTQASYLLQKVAPLVMREVGPRIGPIVADKVGIPLAKKVGLPIARRIGIPIARKTGTILLNRFGYPLLNQALLKVNLTAVDPVLPKSERPVKTTENEPLQTPGKKKPKKKRRNLKDLIPKKKKAIPPVPAPIKQGPPLLSPQLPSQGNYAFPEQGVQDQNPFANYNSSLFNKKHRNLGYNYE
jgi:hypothetical protein